MALKVNLDAKKEDVGTLSDITSREIHRQTSDDVTRQLHASTLFELLNFELLNQLSALQTSKQFEHKRFLLDTQACLNQRLL